MLGEALGVSLGADVLGAEVGKSLGATLVLGEALGASLGAALLLGEALGNAIH